jgi:hypothetical protein
MFTIGQSVQIVNHSEPECNGEYGTITAMDIAYDGSTHYTVELENYSVCMCTHDELMEG